TTDSSTPRDFAIISTTANAAISRKTMPATNSRAFVGPRPSASKELGTSTTEPGAGVDTPHRHRQHRIENDGHGDGGAHRVAGGDPDALGTAGWVIAVIALQC